MSSIAYFPGSHQTSSQSVPSTLSWFVEVTVIAHFLKREARAFGSRGISWQFTSKDARRKLERL